MCFGLNEDGSLSSFVGACHYRSHHNHRETDTKKSKIEILHLTTSSDLSENVHEKLRAHQKKDWHAAPGSVARRLARRLDGSSRPLQQISTTTDGFPRRRSRSESPPLQWQGRFSSTYLIQHHQENEKKQKPPTHTTMQNNNHQPFFFCSCLIGSRSEIRPPAAGRFSSKRFPHLTRTIKRARRNKSRPMQKKTDCLSSFFTDPMCRKSDKQTEHLLYSKRCF